MNRKVVLATSMLWAAAMIASAIVRAPEILTLVLLPALASASLLLTTRGSPRPKCLSSRGASA